MKEQTRRATDAVKSPPDNRVGAAIDDFLRDDPLAGVQAAPTQVHEVQDYDCILQRIDPVAAEMHLSAYMGPQDTEYVERLAATIRMRPPHFSLSGTAETCTLGGFACVNLERTLRCHADGVCLWWHHTWQKHTSRLITPHRVQVAWRHAVEELRWIFFTCDTHGIGHQVGKAWGSIRNHIIRQATEHAGNTPA